MKEGEDGETATKEEEGRDGGAASTHKQTNLKSEQTWTFRWCPHYLQLISALMLWAWRRAETIPADIKGTMLLTSYKLTNGDPNWPRIWALPPQRCVWKTDGMYAHRSIIQLLCLWWMLQRGNRLVRPPHMQTKYGAQWLEEKQVSQRNPERQRSCTNESSEIRLQIFNKSVCRGVGVSWEPSFSPHLVSLPGRLLAHSPACLYGKESQQCRCFAEWNPTGGGWKC